MGRSRAMHDGCRRGARGVPGGVQVSTARSGAGRWCGREAAHVIRDEEICEGEKRWVCAHGENTCGRGQDGRKPVRILGIACLCTRAASPGRPRWLDLLAQRWLPQGDRMRVRTGRSGRQLLRPRARSSGSSATPPEKCSVGEKADGGRPRPRFRRCDAAVTGTAGAFRAEKHAFEQARPPTSRRGTARCCPGACGR